MSDFTLPPGWRPPPDLDRQIEELRRLEARRVQEQEKRQAEQTAPSPLTRRPKSPAEPGSAEAGSPDGALALADITKLLRKVERQVGTEAECRGDIAVTLRALECAIGAQGERHASDSETLSSLLRRVTAIERTLQLVEAPKSPHVTRRRPME